MAEQAKTPSQIESDAEAAKYPNATEVEITLTRPKKEAPDFIPPPVSDSRRYTDDPSMITAAPETALGGGLADGPSPEASPALQIEDDIGLMDEPVGAMVFEDDIDLFDFQGEKHDKMEIAGYDGTPIIIKRTEPETDYAKALMGGISRSASGLALRMTQTQPEEQTFGEDVASMMGEVFGDLPPFLVGFFAGGGPLSPITSMGGGFALNEAVKKVLRDDIQKGKITNPLQWWERFKETSEEAGKGYVTGAVTGYAGQTAKIAGELAGASSVTKTISSIIGQTVAMTQTGSMLEGRIPTEREYALGAVALGIMHGGIKLPEVIKQLHQIYKETKTRPLDVTLEDLADNGARLKRASEQGFVEGQFYHGTTADIKKFQIKWRGVNTEAPSSKKGFFFTISPKVAGGYSLSASGREGMELYFEKEGLVEKRDAIAKEEKDLRQSQFDELLLIELMPEGLKKKQALEKFNKNKKGIEKKTVELFDEESKLNAEIQKVQFKLDKLQIEREESYDRILETSNEAERRYQDYTSSLFNDKTIFSEEIKSDWARFSFFDLTRGQAWNRLIIHFLKDSPEKPSIVNNLNILFKEYETAKLNVDNWFELPEGAVTYPVKLRFKNPFIKDFEGQEYRDESYSDLIDKALENGHDALIIKNTYDPGLHRLNELTDIVVVFEPEQIRSAYDSFLPENIGSKQLIHEPIQFTKLHKILAPLASERGAIGKEREPGPEDIDDLNFKKNKFDPEWDLARQFKEMIENRRAKREKDEKLSIKDGWNTLREMLWNREGDLYEKAREVFGDKAEAFIQRNDLSAGWMEEANKFLERFSKEIDEGLNKKQIEKLDEWIEAERTIEVTKNRQEKIQRLWDEAKSLQTQKQGIGQRYAKFTAKKVEPLKKEISELEKIRKSLEEERDALNKAGKSWSMVKIRTLSGIKKNIVRLEKEIKKLEKNILKGMRDEFKPVLRELEKIEKEREKTKKMKNPGGLGIEHAQERINKFPLKLKELLSPRITAYNRAMREMLNYLHKEGLLDDQAYKAIAEKGEYYSPREFIETFDPEDRIASNVSGKIVMGSGLRRLDDGSIQQLNEQHQMLLETVVKRTVRRVFLNRAAKQLWELAVETEPSKGQEFKDILRDPGEYEELAQVPPGYAELSAVVDGKTKKFWMLEGLAKDYLDQKHIEGRVAKWIQILTATKMLKFSATGFNPEFTLTNLPRDVSLALYASNQYSKFFPLGALQLGKDMSYVLGDLWFNTAKKRKFWTKDKGLYMEATHEGLWQDMYTNDSLPDFKHSQLNDSMRGLVFLQNFFEKLPRLAMYKRGLDNGLSPTEAAWEARKVLDFNKGGKFSKVFDLYSPYFNPAIQGFRSAAEYTKDNKVNAAMKIAQYGMISAGFYYWNIIGSGVPEAYHSISTQDKAKFWVFVLPWFGRPDKNDGNAMRYPYIRIAKDQAVAVMTPTFDYLMSKALNQDFDVGQFAETLHSGFPVTEGSAINPAANALLNYFGNYNFYFRDKVWRGPEVESKAEYNKRTNPMSIKLGEITGMSPMRFEAALSSVWASSNFLSPLTGMFFREIMSELPEAQQLDFFDKWENKFGLRRIIKWTKPYNPADLKQIGELKKSESTIKLENNRAIDRAFMGDKTLSEKMRDAHKVYIKMLKDVGPDRFKKKEADRIKKRKNRLIAMERIGSVPNRPFWFKLDGLSDPSKQAEAYYNTWKKQGPEMQKKYDLIMMQMNAIGSPIIAKKDRGVFLHTLQNLKGKSLKLKVEKKGEQQ